VCHLVEWLSLVGRVFGMGFFLVWFLSGMASFLVELSLW
jgi:hypothetical protein